VNTPPAGIAHEKVFVHPASHAGYYPGATPLTIKLIFSPSDGKLLGAQTAGVSGADKRIDVLAVAIRAGMTVYDLEDLELAYAPPYGSAKDPVNYAGFVAANVLRGDVGLCHVDDVTDPGDDQFLLDVRTQPEFAAGTIPGALSIPLDELRGRLDELPKEKEILVFCQVGLRGYLACRILAQHGFRCRNLTGGYKTFTAATGGCPAPVKEAMTSDTGVESAACARPERGSVRPMKRDIVKEIDATGLQCPGPIMQLARAIDGAKAGDMVKISASDPGFATDGPAWARSTGNELVDLTNVGGIVTAVVAKGDGAKGAGAKGDALPTDRGAAVPAGGGVSPKKKTIVVFSNDLDRAMAAFIIANGAAAMGSDVTLFFTFWGLNLLRRHKKVRVKKSLMERMFGWMMRRGARRVTLSKMHMRGMGTRMMKGVMRRKNVKSLPELIESAQASGVKLVACTMTMDIMGIKREELIDGVEEGGVAMYLESAEAGSVNLFI
jgi:peroxiredoxin family protein/rhodanese-related sulfurtransferase/TusA-related sulfurtransferase